MKNEEIKKPLSKIEKLEKRKTDTIEAIKREKKKANKEKRNWENNQKIRVGAAIISEMKGKPERLAWLLKLLDSFYPKDYDRKYFVEWGLSPHPNDAKSGDEPKNEAGQ